MDTTAASGSQTSNYIKIISKYYSGDTLIRTENTGRNLNEVNDGISGGYQKITLLNPPSSDVEIISTITKIEIYMNLTQGQYGDSVNVQLGGTAYGYYTDPPLYNSFPYNSQNVNWSDTIGDIIRPVVTPKVGNIAIPKDTQQIKNVDVENNPPAQIVNIYNETVNLTTEAPTIVDTPSNLQEEFGFLGNLLRLINGTLTTIKTAVFDLPQDITTDITAEPDEVNINWEPLKLAGNAITYKFPFSIPWDLGRGFEQILGTSEVPDFNINVPGAIMGQDLSIPIDLSIWEGIRSKVQMLMIILFDVGLIMAARKLISW